MRKIFVALVLALVCAIYCNAQVNYEGKFDSKKTLELLNLNFGDTIAYWLDGAVKYETQYNNDVYTIEFSAKDFAALYCAFGWINDDNAPGIHPYAYNDLDVLQLATYIYCSEEYRDNCSIFIKQVAYPKNLGKNHYDIPFTIYVEPERIIFQGKSKSYEFTIYYYKNVKYPAK